MASSKNIPEFSRALSFKDRAAWHAWLEKNHLTAQEAWLVLNKKGSGRPGLALSDSVEEAICFGWIDGKLKSVDSKIFIVKFTPRREKSVWSQINRQRAEKLIAEGRLMPAGLEKINEAKRTGLYENAYTNKKKEKLPSDLKAALLKNKKAYVNFMNFANTYRNMYIGWVKSSKSKETREKRITEAAKRSGKNIKPGV